MTLMEAVVALVILALVAVGCLELAQGASTLEFNATQWNAAVSAAESRMAQVTTEVSVVGDVNAAAHGVSGAAIARYEQTEVIRQPWRAGLDLISVSVPVANRKRYVLRKLVPSQAVRSASTVR